MDWHQLGIPWSWWGSFLTVVREDLRDNKDLSNVAAFSAGPSPHEDCLAEETFVDDVCGGAKRGCPKVSWHGRLGARPS